jgi:hypothetical protein
MAEGLGTGAITEDASLAKAMQLDCECGVVDDVQMTTTLISLDPWLLHHFIISTNKDTLDH